MAETGGSHHAAVHAEYGLSGTLSRDAGSLAAAVSAQWFASASEKTYSVGVS